MNDIYVLVHWPESQQFMDNEYVDQCVSCPNEDGALFVPKELYDKVHI